MQKILPPVLLAVVLVVLGLLPFVERTARLLPDVAFAMGAVGIVLGALIAVLGRVTFERVGTNVSTFREPGELVTKGIFARTRHPMYLGMALVAFGAALLRPTAPALLVALGFWLICDRVYVPFEERWLERKFGSRYVDYTRRVRRWI